MNNYQKAIVKGSAQLRLFILAYLEEKRAKRYGPKIRNERIIKISKWYLDRYRKYLKLAFDSNMLIDDIICNINYSLNTFGRSPVFNVSFLDDCHGTLQNWFICDDCDMIIETSDAVDDYMILPYCGECNKDNLLKSHQARWKQIRNKDPKVHRRMVKGMRKRNKSRIRYNKLYRIITKLKLNVPECVRVRC